MSKIISIVGATGLIGRHLVEILQEDEHVSELRLIVRRPLEINHPKVRVLCIDFTDDASFKAAIAHSHAVFCAVGTTQKKVRGNTQAYRAVDYDIPVRAARFARETACSRFLLVSSVGANKLSKNFYLSLKERLRSVCRSLITRVYYYLGHRCYEANETNSVWLNILLLLYFHFFPCLSPANIELYTQKQ